MTTNTQANEAGTRADEIIKNLATPSQAIETSQATVEVLDTVTPVVPTSEVPAVPVKADVAEDWEKRFKGYKASNDRTVYELRQKVAQFDIVSAENENLKKGLETAQAQIPATPSELLEQFSQEEVDNFTKLIDGRVGGLQGEVERLQAKLDLVEKADAAADAQVKHQNLVSAVKNAVPHYAEIDVNPKFKEWLNTPDTFGNLRMNMLRAAQDAVPVDVGRIVQFYVEFDSQETPALAEAQAEVPAQVEPPKTFTQQELLQTPSSSPSPSGSETPQQGSGIVWDTPTISQFFTDKALGKIPFAEAERLEKEIFNLSK